MGIAAHGTEGSDGSFGARATIPCFDGLVHGIVVLLPKATTMSMLVSTSILKSGTRSSASSGVYGYELEIWRAVVQENIRKLTNFSRRIGEEAKPRYRCILTPSWHYLPSIRKRQSGFGLLLQRFAQ